MCNVRRNCNMATLRKALIAYNLRRWRFMYATYTRIKVGLLCFRNIENDNIGIV
jgi:hypothetical protein